MDSKAHPLLTLPGAIIIAGALIAIAIIWVKKPVDTSATPKQNQATVSMKAITSADHIFGNPSAPVKIVEYSDTACPFCKTFHPTIIKIMSDYGPSGNVAWVYRHFPLDKPMQGGQILHPNAGREAQALECAAALGGNDAFWKYTNRLYEITPSVTQATPDGLDQKELPKIATFAGLDAISFNECVSSDRFREKVEQQYLDGVNAGVSGTPTSVMVLTKPAPKNVDTIIADLILQLRVPILMSDDRLRILMSGALPEEAFKAIIDAIVAVK